MNNVPYFQILYEQPSRKLTINNNAISIYWMSVKPNFKKRTFFFFFINYSDLYTYLIKTRKKNCFTEPKNWSCNHVFQFSYIFKKILKNKDIIQNSIYTQKVHNEQKKLKHIWKISMLIRKIIIEILHFSLAVKTCKQVNLKISYRYKKKCQLSEMNAY